MKKEIKVINTPFGNWRFVEFKNGFPVNLGKAHNKNTPKLPNDIVSKAQSIDELEAALDKYVFKTDSSNQVLADLDALLHNPSRMGQLVANQSFAHELSALLRTKFEGKSVGQMMDEHEFAEYLNGVVDKVMSFTTSLYDGVKTDKQRDKMDGITTYLVGETAKTVALVEKYVFLQTLKELSSQLDQYTDNKTGKQENAKKIEKKKAALEAQIADLEEEFKKAEAALGAGRTKVSKGLTDRADEAAEKRADLEEKIGAEVAAIDEITAESTAMGATIAELIKTVNENKSKNSMLNAQAAGLN